MQQMHVSSIKHKFYGYLYWQKNYETKWTQNLCLLLLHFLLQHFLQPCRTSNELKNIYRNNLNSRVFNSF